MPASARIWIGAGLVAAGFLIAWNWQGSRYEARIATMRSTHAEALADSQERARKVEQGWAAAMIEVQKDARNKQADVAGELDGANDELARLREAAARATRRATLDACTADGSAPAPAAAVLPADLLGACAALYIDVAAEADRRRIAGQACEAAHDALRGAR